MDKEIAAALEDIEGFRREQRLIIEEIRKFKQDEKESTYAKKVDEELERMKKLIGDFHPGPASKTYRELYDENQKLKQNLKEQQEGIASYRTEIANLQERVKRQEQEIMSLRNRPVQKPEPVPVTQGERPEKKKRFFGKKKEETNEKAPVEKTDEERRKQLQTLLFSPRFSDAQVTWLSRILTEDKDLPVLALAQIVDPRLSTDKMLTLYQLLCAKHHVVPVVDQQKNAADPEKPETAQGDKADSGQESEAQSSGKNCLDVASDGNNGGQTRGSIPHKNVQSQKRR